MGLLELDLTVIDNRMTFFIHNGPNRIEINPFAKLRVKTGNIDNHAIINIAINTPRISSDNGIRLQDGYIFTFNTAITLSFNGAAHWSNSANCMLLSSVRVTICLRSSKAEVTIVALYLSAAFCL